MAGLGKGSNPCSVLNSYHAKAEYTLVEESGPPHSKHYVFAVNILGCDYKGTGSSKKRARQAAAASALKDVYQINLSLCVEDPTPSVSLGNGKEKSEEAKEASECNTHHNYYDSNLIWTLYHGNLMLPTPV